MATEKSSLKVTVRWGSEHPAAQPINQFAVQRDASDEIVLTFGYVDVPIISGTSEEQKAQLANVVEHGLEVKSAARLVLSMKTAQDFRQALANELDAKGE